MSRFSFKTIVLRLAALPLVPAVAQDKVLNLYSSRHYQTDEALYTNFTKPTGIKINRIEGGEDALIERIRNEGERSPADVLITVDAGRLWRAEQLGLFQPVKSATARRAHPGQPARARRPLVRLLDARARHRLQQGQGEAGRDRRPTRTWPIRSGRAASACAPPPTSTTCRCWAR